MMNGVGELYEIRFTNQNKDFNMLGRKVPYYYELELEKFHYSQEVINTGVADIDSVVTDSGYTLTLITGTGLGNYNTQELVFQSIDNTFANATTIGTVQSWTPSANALTVTNISGTFTDGLQVMGVNSSAAYYLSTYNPLLNPAKKESYDNITTTTQSSLIINTNEINPMGGI